GRQTPVRPGTARSAAAPRRRRAPGSPRFRQGPECTGGSLHLVQCSSNHLRRACMVIVQPGGGAVHDFQLDQNARPDRRIRPKEGGAMTEAEWCIGTRLDPLLQIVRRSSHYRRWRLLGCACVREVWGSAPEEARAAIEAAEAYADGQIHHNTL